MTNKFYNRNTENQDPNEFSKTLDLYTSGTSFFKPITSAITYTLSLEEIVKSNFVDRKSLPDWFCGFIDLDRVPSYLSIPQQSINNFVDIQAQVSVDTEEDITEPVRYQNDLCLEIGIPGSYSYSSCIETDIPIRSNDDTLFDLASISTDIETQISNVDNLIESSLTDIEGAIFSEIEKQLEESFQEE
jgi:hypothetical protein